MKNRFGAWLFLLAAALCALPAPSQAAPPAARTVEAAPGVSLTLAQGWQVQGQPAAIKSYPGFADMERSIKLVALRGSQVLFAMAQPSHGRSLMQVAQAYEQLVEEKTAGTDAAVYRRNFALLPCEKCRRKNRLAHVTAAVGRGRDLGATAHFQERRVNHVTLSFVDGPWLVTLVYFEPGTAAELPADAAAIIDSLILKGFEDPRDTVFKEVIKYVPAGTAPACAAKMSELAALTAKEFQSVDVPALFNSKKMPDWMKDMYAAPACECYKFKHACDRVKK
jgi:hypothetical protein